MELPTCDRQKYQTRLRSYKTELNKLEKDAVSRACYFNFCMLMGKKERGCTIYGSYKLISMRPISVNMPNRIIGCIRSGTFCLLLIVNRKSLIRLTGNIPGVLLLAR